MPSRFIDSDIFKDPFMRSLKGYYKTFWIYLFCDCTSAGIWSVDFEAASMYCGGKIDQEKSVQIFDGKYEVIEPGKWFIPGFVQFQYKGILCRENKAHQRIINTLTKHGLLELSHEDDGKAYFKLKMKDQGGSKPLHEGDKVEVKVEVKDKVIGKGDQKPATDIFPQTFSPNWEKWKAYKKKKHRFTYHDQDTERAALNELFVLSGGKEPVAEKIIQQSMVAGWKGLFELKIKPATSTAKETDEVRDEFYSDHG